MPSTPQMVSSRKRARRLVFSLSSSAGCCRSWKLRRPGSRRSGRWCFAPILLSKTACGPVCRNKAAEMPCPAICLLHPEQLLSMKECSEREKALPFPAFLAMYHAKKPRNSPKKEQGMLPCARKCGLVGLSGASPCMGCFPGPGELDGCPSWSVLARENMACVFKQTDGSKDKPRLYPGRSEELRDRESGLVLILACFLTGDIFGNSPGRKTQLFEIK